MAKIVSFVAVKGGQPVSISYSSTPMVYTSVAGCSSRPPSCSGDT